MRSPWGPTARPRAGGSCRRPCAPTTTGDRARPGPVHRAGTVPSRRDERAGARGHRDQEAGPHSGEAAGRGSSSLAHGFLHARKAPSFPETGLERPARARAAHAFSHRAFRKSALSIGRGRQQLWASERHAGNGQRREEEACATGALAGCPTPPSAAPWLLAVTGRCQWPLLDLGRRSTADTGATSRKADPSRRPRP
jgi:hypothetical protein